MLLVVLLRCYKWLVDTIESSSRQLEKTYIAVVQSFEDETLLFFDSAQNTLIRSSALGNPSAVHRYCTWSYKQGLFIKQGGLQKKQESFPWLSAVLKKGNEEQWDITEWLEKQRFCGGSCPTADIVVQTWAFYESVALGDLRHYNLKIINELAEEEMLAVVQGE